MSASIRLSFSRLAIVQFFSQHAVLLCGIVSATLVLGTTPVYSDIVIDPNNTAATDVVRTSPFGAITPLSNPVSNPLSLNGYSLIVGNTALGELWIADGEINNSSRGYIGNIVGSTGIVTVDGTNANWMTRGILYVGRSGNGTLNITNGGEISSARGSIGNDSGSTGVVSIDGSGSRWTTQFNSSIFTVGDHGNGTLNITNGGEVIISDSTAIGNRSGSIGVVNIDGTGSRWMTRGIDVGARGNGTLNISNGGVLSNGNGKIGWISGSTGLVTVDGVGSTWMTEALYVGYSGNGTLSITNGGEVSSSRSGNIGTASGATGTATVDGIGSTWTNSGIIVGLGGDGTLNIVNGGNVSSSGSGRNTIGSRAGSTGIVNIDGVGSQWMGSNDLFVGSSGSGTLNVTNSGAVNNRNGRIGYSVNTTGMIIVDGAGSIWTNSDDLTVGSSGTGTLSITSDGTVNVGGSTWVSKFAGSSGAIHFDNGSLTTAELLAAAENLTGTGIINTRGLVTDVDLFFDASHGLTQTFMLNNLPNQNITINLNVDGTQTMGAGYGGVGTMTISDGRVVESREGMLGYKANSMGTVNVDGTDSNWLISNTLTVGSSGHGTLNITNGGTVNVGRNTRVSQSSDSSGTIYFDNGSLTTAMLFAAAENLTGAGVINTRGLVTDVDLFFDASHGLTQSFLLNNHPGQSITINLKVDVTQAIGAGYDGAGTIHISDGIAVETWGGYIGLLQNATGLVAVDGIGSKWISYFLYVGNRGSGTLTIKDGGEVRNTYGTVGDTSSSMGTVTVDGVGSKWISSNLLVGNYGDGILNIIDGGEVQSVNGTVGNRDGAIGVVTVDGVGSKWTNSQDVAVGKANFGPSGSGILNITNGGLVSVAGTLTLDVDLDNDSFINMSTGGMLALFGDADDSLEDFYSIINGTDAIRYWDDAAADWADLTEATLGSDYTLEFQTTGDLAGYTLLTVGTAVPEPSTVALLLTACGALGLLRHRCRWPL